MKTEIKSHIAVIKAKTRLLELGYFVFDSDVDYRLPYDLIAVCPAGKVIRIQVKYSASGNLASGTGYQSLKDRKHITIRYNSDSFDYYAAYLPSVDVVIFPSVVFVGARIATELRTNHSKFYWYKDFLNLTDTAEKKSCTDFGKIPVFNISNIGKRFPDRHKVNRPSVEELRTLLWEIPTVQIASRYGVSDNGVARWVKEYELNKPPRGYWQKLRAK